MPDSLSIRGTLAETTVPDLFRSLVRNSESAVVALDAIGRNDNIYFRDGKIIFASSSDSDLGLGESLLRSGELNIQQYQHAVERLLVPNRIGALLIESGYLKPEELMRAAERQASAIVLNAMAYRTGSYTVEFTEAVPEGVIALPLATERLILDGVRRVEYWSLILRGISRLDRLLEQVPGSDMRSFNLELTDEESHILSLLSDTQTVEKLCARSYLSNFVTCRTVWGLLAVNLIQDAESAALDDRRAATETEYELEAIVERYNTLYETIFRMVRERVGDHVYDFTDRVVVHLSPETLPYLSGMTFVNDARIDFDQLYINLIASGSEDFTPIVHNVLNELLYGWIFEIKREFGQEMESQAVRLAHTLK